VTFPRKTTRTVGLCGSRIKALRTTTKLLPSIIHALLDIPDLGSEFK
jgi:hypothetical protein